MVSAWWLLVASALGVAVGIGLSALFSINAGADHPRSQRFPVRPFEEDRAGGPSTVA